MRFRAPVENIMNYAHLLLFDNDRLPVYVIHLDTNFHTHRNDFGDFVQKIQVDLQPILASHTVALNDLLYGKDTLTYSPKVMG